MRNAGNMSNDALIAIVAREFAGEGNEMAVRVLAEGQLEEKVTHITESDYAIHADVIWCFIVPQSTWLVLGALRAKLEEDLATRFSHLAEPYDFYVREVRILPVADTQVEEWRERAINWLRRDGVTNQGRARSTNVAPIEHDGLLFRSRAEVNLYNALKKTGVTFAPLPVFIRGGANYRRVEPDFIIIKNGIMLHVEIDGEMIDHGTPLEADRRNSIFKPEGVTTERVSASECNSPELALGCADRLIRLIDKLKASR